MSRELGERHPVEFGERIVAGDDQNTFLVEQRNRRQFWLL